MAEHYCKWIPLPEAEGTLCVEGLYDDWEGFRVILSGEDQRQPRLRLNFSGALAYRNANEGDLLLLWDDSAAERGLGKHSLYTVSDSKFAEWLHLESRGIRRPETFIHYAIMTPEDCIDVLASESPNVDLLPRR